MGVSKGQTVMGGDSRLDIPSSALWVGEGAAVFFSPLDRAGREC
jgi:hypothetical protein